MRKIEYLFSLPKSIYFCFITLPFKQAIKCPILIHYNTKLLHLNKGVISLDNISFGTVRFGFEGTDGIQPYSVGRSCIDLAKKAKFARNTTMRVGGTLTFGENFSSNVNTVFSCNSSIQIGRDVLVGWSVNIRDSDNHYVTENGIVKSDREDAHWKSCVDMLLC
ncbi:hypothetical protein ACPYNU_02070 [Enterococcus faecium]|uniref:hypothetical protein n=2 Tax=Enterococcus TaxID=1350 RepID=UPI00101F5DA9|nr:hypothetical protein [Enterococcus faecium]MCU1817713.1 hypothetical protein [Enterococcus faecium]MCU1830475.1 hypothetical protein [Enterococcus faecium]MCU1948196.1 hypothetical protein [Enterococcus faecium]MCY7002387.1 hypothetical protein [Enterococcus faecium]MDW7850873.1 hypothetical protein [Enterococcus faecium]